ncbi:MAG: hypothetical protein SWK76_16390 [Actinomycetota bacterium]|nr:hypothetical protein [Actinomycetota bacterium]
MIRNQGIEHDNWDFQTGAVPLAAMDNYRLFRDGLIMCGTMSGTIDPFMGFGIGGVLVTGKVAATAVTDPEGAQREFDRNLGGFRRSFYIKEVWKRLVRPYVSHMERNVRLLGVEAREQGHASHRKGEAALTPALRHIWIRPRLYSRVGAGARPHPIADSTF